MRNSFIKVAVLSTLGLAAIQVVAAPGVAGFTNLPAGSIYTECSISGNYGSATTTAPTATGLPQVGGLNNNGCAVFPASELKSPIAGFGVSGTDNPSYSRTASAVMNNTYTGGVAKTVGTVTEYVWRNRTTATECIYGAKFTGNNTDYNPAAGNQYFEMNDFARAGFAGLPVNVAYFKGAATSEVLFRVGRTYTSVQHRAFAAAPSWGNAGGVNPGTGYVSLPATGSTVSINGVNPYTGLVANALPLANPTAAQQQATNNDDWVDFTSDAVFLDDDGTTKTASSMFYVKSTCPAVGAPPIVTDAIRLRQTGQENAPFIEVSVSGYKPTSAAATPAHVNPF